LHLLHVDQENPPGGTGNSIGIAASNREQAGICYKAIMDIRRNSQRLQDATHVVPSKKELTGLRKQSFLKCMSKDNKGAHGNSFSLLYIDEGHTIGDTSSDQEYLDALIYSASKRDKSLVIWTTTAGYRKTGKCWSVYNYAKQVQSGNVSDPTFFAQIFEATPEDDPGDRGTWNKANPSLDLMDGRLSSEQFALDYQQAKLSNSTMASYRRQRLNQWTSAETNFIDLSHYDACFGAYPNFAPGTPLVLALDLASHQDLSALSGIINYQNKYYVLSWAWTTSRAIEVREKQNLMRFQDFIQAGELYLEEGDTINYSLIRDKIKEISRHYKIKAIVCDPAGSNETSQLLQLEKYNVLNFGQSKYLYNDPMRRLEKLIIDGRLVHNGNSLLRWQLGNLQAKDSNGMLSPSKATASEKIDSWVAVLMALSQVNDASEAKRKSIYETKEIMRI